MGLFRRPFLNEETPSNTHPVWWWCKAAVRGLMQLSGVILCAGLTAYLFKLSYPKPAHSLLAWLALAPFTIAIVGYRRFHAAFIYSWFTGCLVYAGLYYWVFITCWQGGGLSKGLAAAAWLGLSGLMALQFAIFGVSCFYLKRLKSFFPLLAAMGWVALEWGHEMLATYALGFPWFTLGYSQWNLPQVIQVASFTGVGGVSFAVAFAGLSIGYAFVTPSLRKGTLQLFLAMGMFVGVYGFGNWALKQQPAYTLLRLKAAVMQPNIDQYKKWSPEFETEIYDTLTKMSSQVPPQTMLMVWPESVIPGAVQDETYKPWVEQLAQGHMAWQVMGSNRVENGKNYVSAFLFAPQVESSTQYDKMHLVPFGEFIPAERWLRRLLPQVDVLGELGSFTAGSKGQPLLAIGQVPFGSTICYESVFSHSWREQVKAGARFFVNITNDAWFLDTDAPYQHLAVSVLRAVELHRPVLRAANTGISAVISAQGKILSTAALNTRAVLTQEIDLPLGLDLSFYGRWGDWFCWLCAAFYFTILISVMAFAYE